MAVCLLAAAFLQTTLSRYNPWLGYIDWLLLVAVYASSLRDPVLALLTATAAGALYDSLSGGVPIGVNGIAKVLATYLAYWVSSKIVAENLLVSILNVAGASVVNTLVSLAFYRMLKFTYLPPLSGGNATLAAVAMGVLANLTVSIPLYFLLDRVFKGAGLRSRRSEAMRMRRR
ncbi:MAG TPA: rod shape-determining protein MreD [Solirubrobacterales bacterium]|jgi:rod shape-determining protein MreD|nr:rod shape-determining protein MreD [Solirubrobacterales bacterium]